MVYVDKPHGVPAQQDGAPFCATAAAEVPVSNEDNVRPVTTHVMPSQLPL